MSSTKNLERGWYSLQFFFDLIPIYPVYAVVEIILETRLQRVIESHARATVTSVVNTAQERLSGYFYYADRLGGHRYLLARDDHCARNSMPWHHYDRDAGWLPLAFVK